MDQSDGLNGTVTASKGLVLAHCDDVVVAFRPFPRFVDVSLRGGFFSGQRRGHEATGRGCAVRRGVFADEFVVFIVVGSVLREG